MSDKHQPLTDEQIDTAWDCWFGKRGFQASPKQARREFARAIERATAGPAEREALRARAESAEAERDALKETLHDEMAENLRLRELGGAGPDEGITAMTERIIAERDKREHQLCNILARIYRDGGQHMARHGTDEAVRAADDVLAGWIAAVDERDRLRTALQEADTIMGHDDAETEWRERWAHLWGEK